MRSSTARSPLDSTDSVYRPRSAFRLSTTSGNSVGVARTASKSSMSSRLCSMPKRVNCCDSVVRRNCSKGVRGPPRKVSTIPSCR